MGNIPRLITTLSLQHRKGLPVWKNVLPVALKTGEKTGLIGLGNHDCNAKEGVF